MAFLGLVRIQKRIEMIEQTELADVLTMSSVLEVYAQSEKPYMGISLFGRVLEYDPLLIRDAPFILRKWTSSSKLSKEELTYVPVWVKFHGVPVSVFAADGLSAIATRLGTPIMLDSCIATTFMQSWGRMNYVRVLVDIRVD
ncbi:zinc finger, CCHC-type containing protein [Tanacetum coccineum]